MDHLSLLSRNLIAPLAAFKGNEKHFSILKEFRRTQYLNSQELKAYQQERLNKLMIHAFGNVSFYRERLKKANINPHKDKVSDYFQHIPLLTKEEIQIHSSELIASNYDKDKLIANKTGGSTGKPLHYFHNKECIDSKKAAEIRHNQWAGCNVGDKTAIIWGAPRDFGSQTSIKAKLRNLLIDRRLVLDSSSLTEQKMLDFARNFIKFRPKVILAYANSMYEFAKFVKERNITDIAPRSIITSAEVLHDHERDLIEKVFDCKIFNRYGCREVSVIASECKEHKGLHIAADRLLVEFIKDDGNSARRDEAGNIVITDFFNFGMPFIRYKIEDTATPADRVCSCGITLPLMEKVTGRVTDFLITPEGVKISGPSIALPLVASTPGIKQAQFIQNKRDEIILKLVRSDDFTDDSIKYLYSRIPDFFGKNVKVICQFVDDIPKTASGKYRLSICNIKDNKR